MYIHIHRGEGGTPVLMLGHHGDSQRGRGMSCAEGLLGAPDLSRTQRGSGEKKFIYFKIRCISAGFDPADSLPYSLLKLLN